MKLTEQGKQNIINGRKQWFKENPDKHPWRSKNKFKSVPCEKVKEFLRSLGISFIEEFEPQIKGRNFSIDIALPDKMIALEINGNQHYEKTGELKPYYKERHDLIESAGWTIYEIHYSACFKLEKWMDFVNQLKNSPVKIEFDYFNYVPREIKKWFCVDCGILSGRYVKRCIDCRKNKTIKNYYCNSCGKNNSNNLSYCDICKNKQPKNCVCECGNYKHYAAKKCEPCSNFNTRKVKNRPTKEELEKLIWEKPLTKIGQKYGVSDNAVRKWCKNYGITNMPSSSYRTKKYFESLNNF